MNNSQSSDIFSLNTSFSGKENEPMDTVTYETLLLNTKQSLLCKNLQFEVKNICFYENFSSVLEDCSICINQSLDLIISLLDEETSPINSLCEYMNNCVSLLQLLSNFIKNVVECVSMSCQSMKTFPLTTAQMILVIFKHCKESENLYGSNLSSVQTQLKDIFRSCHELQLTYLMLLDKHFVFDLSEADEKEIFLQALDLNLKIGELVQSLDVKTMAEQWKGISLLCDKYAASLVDKQVFGSCCGVLCKIVVNNLDIALQIDQEDKVIVRSLKVSCFAIKILMKQSTTFKHAVKKDYKDVMETLCLIYLQNPAFAKINKTPLKFASLIKTNVTNPADALLKDLVLDEQFINCILQYDWYKLKRDNTLLGFTMLLTNVIKLWLRLEDQVTIKDTYNLRLVKLLQSCVPSCQHWFNNQIEMTINDTCNPIGFSTYILMHIYSLCLTLNSKQYLELEQVLYEVVMSTESKSALFALNLWVLIARETKPQTTISQLVTLIRTYQHLEKHLLFLNSPQELHLRYIIRELFKILDSENRMTIYKEFNINDKNAPIWSILEVKNLPDNILVPVENNVLETFKFKIQKLFGKENSIEDITDVVNICRLASTCRNTNDVAPEIIQLWMKMCPEREFITINKEVDKSNLWYLQLLEAVIMLTFSVEQHVWHDNDLIKIIHVISAVMDTGNIQLSLIATNALYKLARFEVNNEDFYRLFNKVFTSILNDDMLKSRLLFKLWGNEKHLILSKVAREKSNLQRLNKLLSEYDESNKDNEDIEVIFRHQCLEEVVTNVTDITREKSSNFEFDIDSILDMDASEPECKKRKTDIDAILARIESDSSSLCKIDSNELSHKDKIRIKAVCNNFNLIIN